MMKYFGLPVLASKHGADVDRLVIYIHILMALLFVGWAVYFVYTLWRFRASRANNADYVGARTHASTYVEVAVAVAEMVLLFALAVPFWANAADEFPKESESTVMRIIGRQFNWIARYPGADGKLGANKLDLVASDNPLGLDKNDPAAKDDIILESSEMAVPVNKPVIAHITSLDVIHSFKVVAIRMTQDATPGFAVPVHFVPTLTNTYQIQCSQLCGNGHYSMRGYFKVLPPEEYDAWIKSKPTVGAGAVSYE
jgi:cytochrome c oxidase subunit II